MTPMTDDRPGTVPGATAGRHPHHDRAAWLGSRRGDITVGPAPAPTAGPGEIVVRNHAVAVNPLDWIIRLAGSVAYRWVDYPAVLGADLAGRVEQVGEGVTRFRVGDRVLAQAVGVEKDRNSPAEGAFRTRTTVLAHLAAPIPDALGYEDAAVLPLGVSTAAAALFQSQHLGLDLPSPAPAPRAETVLVWGGSSSVGSNAIQLAAAAGYRVVTTCSPHNVDYVRELGAGVAFDYRSRTVVRDILAACAGSVLVGAVAVSAGSARPCAAVLRAAGGPKRLAIASPPVSFATLDDHSSTAELTLLALRIGVATGALLGRCRLHGIRAGFIQAASIRDDHVSHAIYRDFLPAALAAGSYRAAPNAHVVGDGLEAIPAALDLQRRGVSARKVVVTLRTEATAPTG